MSTQTIVAAALRRDQEHKQSMAERAIEIQLMDLVHEYAKPVVPSIHREYVPPAEPVVSFGASPEDSSRYDALVAHAAKMAAKGGVVLRGNERAWELAFIASAQAAYRVAADPVGKAANGLPIFPLHGRSGDPKVYGHAVMTSGAGMVGVKVFDAFGGVMFCLGVCRLGQEERWSRFTRGFERLAGSRPGIFSL